MRCREWVTKEELQSKIKIVNSGCWEWQACTVKGYGNIRRHGRAWAAHRLSYFLFNPNAPLGALTDVSIYICHHCDNRKCINPDHLFLGDLHINIADMVNKKRHNHGSHHSQAKFNSTIIKKIRRDYIKGIKQKNLSVKYGVEQSYISRIVNQRARALN
jgi:hypothetical protein